MNKIERIKRDDFIVELHNHGASHKEIRESLEDRLNSKIGRHTLAMIVSRLIAEGHCEKRELSKQGHDRKRVHRALALRARGEIVGQIANETGISSATLRVLFRQNKVRCGEGKAPVLEKVVNSRGNKIGAA
jgi:hypothetical protein